MLKLLNKAVCGCPNADYKREAPDHTGIRIWKSNSQSADHRKTGASSWCETARKEIRLSRE